MVLTLMMPFLEKLQPAFLKLSNDLSPSSVFCGSNGRSTQKGKDTSVFQHPQHRNLSVDHGS